MDIASRLPKIGVFFPFEGSFASPILRGLKQAGATVGLRLVIFAGPTHGIFNQLGAEYPLDQLGYDPAHLDGTISFFGAAPMIGRLGELHRDGHPCILVMRTAGDVPQIFPDEEPAIGAVVRRLHRHGHSRIAFLRGPANVPSAVRRFAAYRLGLERAGLPLDPDLILQGDFVEATGWRSVGEALDRNVSFTALVAANDLSAFGALRALKAHGLRVPDDVQLVGFDNLPGAPLCDPPLTTFRLPVEEMAHAAVLHMASLLRGEPVPFETRLPVVFIDRASTRFTDHDPLLDGEPPPDPSSDPELEQLLAPLSSETPLEDVLVVTEAAFNKAIRGDRDLDAVAATVLRRAGANHPGECQRRRLLGAALTLTLNTARLTRVQAAEAEHTFQMLTIPLRQLIFETHNEPMAIEVLRETLGAVGFRRAGIYLQDPPVSGRRQESGRLHVWDLVGKTAREVPATPRDVQLAALELSERYSVIFVLPLIARGLLIGNLVADGDCRFTDYLSELAGRISAALHSVRLYRDLASTNESLRESQRELIEVSRLAGIAEVATGVLHNIGNALNSVNTSVGVIADRIHDLKIDSVGKIEQLLVRETESWCGIFTQDERGLKVVGFVHSLQEHLEEERVVVLDEIRSLREGVEHVNHIVVAQQSFAQISGMPEDQDPSEPLEYALRLCETELMRHKIAIVRDYKPAPRVCMERHKAVQIFVNLVRNAKESLSQSGRDDKQIRVGVRTTSAGEAQCYVADNGGGIAADLLPRMFTMGFTTKRGGHGFGLHNSAVTAATLGGSLHVESEGPGCGATFIFTLPPASGDDA